MFLAIDLQLKEHYGSRMLHCITYIALILAINVAFVHVPIITLPNGEMWPPISLAVGFTFVLRDFAQKHVGHHVLWCMLIGCGLSWYFASPALAYASAVAFGIGELADWAVFTFTKRPFSQRILFSSLLGAPLDSVIFLTLVGIATPFSVISMTLSKFLGAYIVYLLVKKRENTLQHQEA